MHSVTYLFSDFPECIVLAVIQSIVWSTPFNALSFSISVSKLSSSLILPQQSEDDSTTDK